MAFYDLERTESIKLVSQINSAVLEDLKNDEYKNSTQYFLDEDTYIRKSAYLAIGKIYKENKNLQKKIISVLENLFCTKNFKIRQTVINSDGEIKIYSRL